MRARPQPKPAAQQQEAHKAGAPTGQRVAQRAMPEPQAAPGIASPRESIADYARSRASGTARTAAAAGRSDPPRTGIEALSGKGVVQGQFKFAGVPFVYNEVVLSGKIDLHAKAIKQFLSREGNKAALMAKIKQWAESDDAYPNLNSYAVLLTRAADAVVLDRAREREKRPLPQVDPGQSIGPPIAPDDALAQAPSAKLETLKKLRRSASAEGEELAGQLRKKEVRRLYHKGDPTQVYTIAGNGQFLLGGVDFDTYAELIDQLKRATETGNRELATILLQALSGKDYEAVGGGPLIRKFVSLVHGSEFARAVINPISAAAVLEEVIESGEDLFTALRNRVLFIISEKVSSNKEGGSKRSQFHREKIDETDPEFIQIATNEHDALARAAAKLGYDPTNRESFEAFIKLRSRAHVDAHKLLYQRSAPPEVVHDDGPSTSGSSALAEDDSLTTAKDADVAEVGDKRFRLPPVLEDDDDEEEEEEGEDGERGSTEPPVFKKSRSEKS